MKCEGRGESVAAFVGRYRLCEWPRQERKAAPGNLTSMSASGRYRPVVNGGYPPKATALLILSKAHRSIGAPDRIGCESLWRTLGSHLPLSTPVK